MATHLDTLDRFVGKLVRVADPSGACVLRLVEHVAEKMFLLDPPGRWMHFEWGASWFITPDVTVTELTDPREIRSVRLQRYADALSTSDYTLTPAQQRTLAEAALAVADKEIAATATRPDDVVDAAVICFCGQEWNGSDDHANCREGVQQGRTERPSQ